MPFTHDIFLSYAHKDNSPLVGGDGWATSFHQCLRLRVGQLLGDDPAIWWDDRNQENNYLVAGIGDKISSSMLLTAILSPLYANSAWCRAELKEFCSRADSTGGILLEGIPRVFCAVKTPVKGDRIPLELRGLNRFEFYEVDASDKVREFRPEIGEHRDQKYWDKFEDLAQAIKHAIETMKPKAEQADESKELPLTKKVYLAETSMDMRSVRDGVKRELLEQGYVVLPDEPLPLNVPDFQNTVRDHLARCSVSIHILGEGYGVIPDGEETRSIVRLQLELATKRSTEESSFAPLVWMPPGLEPKVEHQRVFVDELKRTLGAELLQTSFDYLKSRVLEKLKPEQSMVHAAASRFKRVYVICDDKDLDDIKPIEDCLFNEGYEVIPSINDGNSEDLARYHRENLITCDATLIFYGHANQLWLRLKMTDLVKAFGWGRSKPMLDQAIYVTGPRTAEKERFRTREARVIENYDAFSCDTLRPFISAINGANGGRP